MSSSKEKHLCVWGTGVHTPVTKVQVWQSSVWSINTYTSLWVWAAGLWRVNFLSLFTAIHVYSIQYSMHHTQFCHRHAIHYGYWFHQQQQKIIVKKKKKKKKKSYGMSHNQSIPYMYSNRACHSNASYGLFCVNAQWRQKIDKIPVSRSSIYTISASLYDLLPPTTTDATGYTRSL